MKKSILLVACLSLLVIGAISVSCSKDKETSKGCKCIYYYDGESETQNVSASRLKEEGFSSCAELMAALRQEGDNVTCTSL
jgi:hypothetical protein